MNFVALRMLTGDRAKYAAIIFGLTCAALLVTQQVAIFLGYMTRTYSFVDDTPQADVWVANPELEFIDDHKRMPDTALQRVRGVEGVKWAVPLFKGQLNVRTSDGKERASSLIGLDDATLMGAPRVTLGSLTDLRGADAVIVDEQEASGRFAHENADGTKVPLKIGDTLEINDHAVKVAGFCKITKPFFWQPVVYSTYSLALRVSPQERRMMTFVMAKARPGVDLADLCQRIRAVTGQAAYTANGFRKVTAIYVVQQTGIAINFGIAVLLGFVIGTAVAGQTFYQFTLDHLRTFATLKAMGASDFALLKMVLTQSALAGVLGYGLGVGAAALFGKAVDGHGLAFVLPWQVLIASAGVVAVATLIPAMLALRRVLRLEPGIVFRG